MKDKETKSWFAAKTRFGQELKIKSRLLEASIEHFIPTGTRKNFRGKQKEYPLVHNLVFIRTTKEVACALKTEWGLPLIYLFDYANHTMLTVPDKQMEDFIRVFEVTEQDKKLLSVPLEPGDKVRIVRGPLMGVEGIVQEMDGKSYVGVTLIGCVFARALVSRVNMEKVE